MPWIHTLADVAALVERELGQRPVTLARHQHGIVNAVYFVELAAGGGCVVRISELRYRDYVKLELWAIERARATGVPVPELLAADTTATAFPEPYLITRRVPGLPGDSARLSLPELLDVCRDLGRCLARLHRIAVPGFGELAPSATGPGFGGPHATLWEYVEAALTSLAAGLPHHERPQRRVETIRARFAPHRGLFERRVASFLHGDVQGKNLVVAHGRVAALLDFECAQGGDPALDFRVIDYWDSKREALLGAMVEGYAREAGSSGQAEVGPHAAFRRRLLLFELLYALERLASAYRGREPIGVEEGYRRLDRIERALDVVDT
jgi:aminoglycoside phosphotransferase (APT) family kinase protein